MRFIVPNITKSIELPSFPWSVVIMRSSLNTAEQRDLVKKYKDIQTDQSQAIDMGIDSIVMLISSRSFTDDNDKTLAITRDIIEQLPSEDFALLLANLSLEKKG